MQKPWNIPNFPVYSLVTENNGVHNYNICTYVTAISMKPKLFAIAVFENTKTLINTTSHEFAVLQLLNIEQHNLVRILGKKSGKQVNKEALLQKRKLLESWNDFKVIKNTCSHVLLKKLSSQKTGDHHLFIYEAIKQKSYATNYLSIEKLKEKKLIRL